MDESTPKIPNVSSEDSGFSTLHESKHHESTPIIYEHSIHTRKRKFSQVLPTRASPYSILCSTLNDSNITSSFERWNISSFSPNFYVERSSEAATHDIERKQCSTPEKVEVAEERTEFYRMHTEASFQRTPTKCGSLQKLGSPERNRILYGDLRPNSFTKLESSVLNRNSPAKKRLFQTGTSEWKRAPVRSHLKLDPVKYFARQRALGEIVEKVIGYLGDIDVYRFSRVSNEWKMAVMESKGASIRLNSYMNRMRLNKENCHSSGGARRKSGVACQETRVNEGVDAFVEMARLLNDGQILDKCPLCRRPSIVEKNIGQCQHHSCGYIYCRQCNSSSRTGPENFVDACTGSRLQLTSSHHKPRLTDSPRKAVNRHSLSFILDSTLKYDSSGYATDMDTSVKVDYIPNTRRRSIVLAELNCDLQEVKQGGPRRHSFVPVITKKTSAKREIMEPSSPPKIRNVACSASSKRNLKRLIRP